MNSWARLSFRRVLLICFSCIAVAIAATIPLVEMAINDDFSYTRVALNAAQTGRLIYSGWGSPTVGLQAYWAALFIKIFGFSFQIVRLSALPFTFGCAAILLSLFKRAGLSPLTALFAVLTVMLSPVAIPLEPTFMTDITSLFFVLLTIWCADHAVHSGHEGDWYRWLFATALAGLAGTTIRQSVALALVVTLPFVAWRAARRSHAVIAILALLISAGCVAALNVWYQAQPYGVPLPLIDKANFKGYRMAVYNAMANVIQVPLFVLPAMFLTVAEWRKFSRSVRAALLSVGLGAAGFLWYVWRSRPYIPKIPFGHLGGNMVTQWGLLGANVEILGDKPVVLRTRFQIAIIAVTISFSVAIAFWIVELFRRRRSVVPPKTFTREYSAFVLLGLYACAYIPLVVLRSYVAVSFDRYLIPILPAAVLGICLLPGVRLRTPGPAAWALLAGGCFFGVGIAHDYFSESRGRSTAVESLLRAGIPRTSISAGLEYDMWTQMENSSHINDPMIVNPADAFVPVDNSSGPIQPSVWFWKFAPVIKPRFILVLSPQRGLSDSGLPPITFSRWLAADGQVLIQSVVVDPSDRSGLP